MPELSGGPAAGASLPQGIVRRDGGLHFDTGLPAASLLAAVDRLFAAGAMFAGLDYLVFLKVLYGAGAPLPRGAVAPDLPLVRFARAVTAFAAPRRALYKSLKIISEGAEAEYYFEPVFEEGAYGLPARLDFDEFVAALWGRGVRFGIDANAVQAALASGRAERIVVARRLAPIAGRDAMIVEVSQQLHRSDAPRERADGRLDLLNFKNRFPEVKKHARLLRKQPAAPGSPGVALSGASLPMPAPQDADLAALAGAGTEVEQLRDGLYLVATQDGFLDVDAASNRLSVSAVIVSRDGVSSRTTGNLHLRRAYEEFGEVQEQRSVEGADITIHGDVFGKIQSRGGDIVLKRNLVGGSAHNSDGDIGVAGVASGALLQTRSGEVVIERAENCVISGTRVRIAHAANCDIMADEVSVGQAEGCAIAARRISIGSAGPRKQHEMLLFPLVPDLAAMERKIAALRDRAGWFGNNVAELQRESEALASRQDVQNYMALAVRVRKQEVQLTPEQLPQFQKMALAVGPALKTIGKLSLDIKSAQAQQEQVLQLVLQAEQQKRALAGASFCRVSEVTGETLVRCLPFDPDGAAAHDKAAKEIKALLHAPRAGAELVFADSEGALDWTFDPPQ